MSLSGRRHLLLAAMAVAVVAALCIMSLRTISAISFERPLMVVTSGAEEEALQGVLRAMEGNTYVDPNKIPFSASYYNWAFYTLEAKVITQASKAFNLETAWIPTIGRLLAMSSAVLCWLAALACLRRVSPSTNGAQRLHDHLLALWLGFGPLVGWWGLSINVELWATLCTMLASLALLALYPRRPLLAVALASLFSVLAWSFKQSYIFVPMALGMILLIRRDWKGMAITVLVHLAGVILPLALGSPEYRNMMLAWRSSGFSMFQFQQVMFNVPTKILPLLLVPIGLPPLLRQWRALRDDLPLMLGLCGVIACLPLIPASAKIGAAENYFFPAAFFLAIISTRVVRSLAEHRWPAWPTLGLAGVWAVQGAACIAVLAGYGGVTDVRNVDARYRSQRPCVADLPAPMFALDNYLSLPWMHAGGPHFIMAYQYRVERINGQAFEGGGIGGLIQQKYFRSIVYPTGFRGPLEGVPLDGYRLARENCAGLDIYAQE